MTIDLQEVQRVATALSPWAHLATVRGDGSPDVVPVHPCWEGEAIWIMVGRDSVKTRNVAVNDRVALHWQVTENGDGVEVWGRASIHDDLSTKRRLWHGVFDYDLNAFAPGGPENSPDTVFMKVEVARALVMRAYGMAGIERWRAKGTVG